MSTRSYLGWLVGAALMGCGDEASLSSPSDWSFERWCEGSLCDWDTEGTVVPADTWHSEDLAVSFGSPESRVSQLLPEGTTRCFLFDTIVDVEPQARLTLQLDFNDDGTVDFEQLLAGASWKTVRVAVPAPISYENVRFIVVKKASGRAVLAQLRAEPLAECGGEPTRLRDGSTCSGDEVCEVNHHCVDGRCSSLPASSRAE